MKSLSFSAARRRRLLFVSYAAMIAALYVVLTVVFGVFSFGPIQFRLAEILTVLPFFTSAAVPGLSVGCLIANMISGNPYDVVFGTLATALASLASYLLRKNRLLVTLPPILFNAVTVPLILKFTYPDCMEEPLIFLMLTVFIGELLACTVLGYPLIRLIEKRMPHLFNSLKRP